MTTPNFDSKQARHFASFVLSCVACASASLLPDNARAWGADGHRLVAEAADSQLTVSARAEVARLLALEPGATLASISTWADEVRSPSTASWPLRELSARCRLQLQRRSHVHRGPVCGWGDRAPGGGAGVQGA